MFKRTASATLVFVTVAAGSAGLAWAAGDLVFYDGYLNGNQAAPPGPRHSLTSVSVRKLDSNTGPACINAIDDDTHQYAGETRCATHEQETNQHPYCGCKLRYGVAFAGANVAVILRAREQW